MNLTQVARREYLAQVRSRVFIIMTVMVPAIMATYMFILPLLFSSSGTDVIRVAVIDAGTGLGPALGDHLAAIERPRVDVAEQVVVPDGSERSRAPYTDAVRDTRLDGYLLLTEDTAIVARGRYYAREMGNPTVRRELERAVDATILASTLFI